jgi:hypothetical protein
MASLSSTGENAAKRIFVAGVARAPTPIGVISVRFVPSAFTTHTWFA